MVTVIIQKKSKGQEAPRSLGFAALHTKAVIISISRIMMESYLPLLGNQEDQDSGHKLHK